MISFLKFPLFSLLLLLAYQNPASAAQTYTACAKVKNFVTPSKINLETPPPLIEQKQNRTQLNANQGAAHQAWIKQNNMQAVWSAQEIETLGQAAGGWGMMSMIRFTAKPYDAYGSAYCPYFGPVELNMIYRTIISIPNEFKPGSCEYSHILKHELRHHETNVTVAREVVARLEKDLPTIITEVEKSGSYVTRNQVDPRFKYMQASLEGAAQIYLSESMQKEMNRRNQLIDSPAEYQRTDGEIRKCKDQ